MKPRADTPRERQRILRLLAGRSMQLPWPCSNLALQAMLSEQWIEVTHRWNEVMGSGKQYSCAKIGITDAGREALQVQLTD